MSRLLNRTTSALCLAALALFGCASTACRPVAIVVANKQETSRLDTGPSPVLPTPTGALEEAVQPTIVREYSVQSREGRWYSVSADQFNGAQVGSTLNLCQ